MAQAPDSLGFRFAVVLALAVIIVAITTWAANQERDSAESTRPRALIYGAQHLNLSKRSAISAERFAQQRRIIRSGCLCVGDASSRIADACAWPGLTRDAGRALGASKGGDHERRHL